MSGNNTEISRVARSKDEAKVSYNKMSKWYDMLAGFAENKYRNTGIYY